MTLIGLGVLGSGALWIVALFFQTLMAWGLRGEPKPPWFKVFSLSVYGAPVMAVLAAVIAVVVLSTRR